MILLKRTFSVLLLFILFISICEINVNALNEQDINVSAKSAILVCADSGQVIYSKNDKEKLPMASTTKIMTAILALEYSKSEDKKVQITNDMIRVEGSSMGLMPGNVLTLENVVKGMMMCSGNDAANTLALSISGSREEFANLMNEKAKQIGMNDTNFVTPSGLDNENHYSTAYDMALLANYAMNNENFRNIVSQKSIRVPFIEPKESHTYQNHNKLLKTYEPCIGIKTGFTKTAGRCLVSAAIKDNKKLIAVTLKAPSDWDDHKKMFEYGFNKVKCINFDDSNVKYEIPVVGGENDIIHLKSSMSSDITVKSEDADKITRVVEVPRFVYAPVSEGDILGSIVYKLDSKVIAVNNLTSEDRIGNIEKKKSLWCKLKEFISNNFNLD